MSIASTDGIEADTTVTADVCVVGAGPAGLAIALHLSRHGRTVLLLESGGLEVDGSIDELSELEDAGAPRHRSGPRRDRRLGGTAWYGRLVRLDPIDFEARPWVPHSGWPIQPAEIDRRTAEAAAFLGLGAAEVLSPAFWRREPAYQTLDTWGLAPRVHVIVPQKDLGRRHRSAVAREPRLTALLHATVVHVEVDPLRRMVTGLRVAAPSGRQFTARGGRYVLACGGLENAQLLLALADRHPGALGASHAALGRFLMDHARVDGLARLYLNPEHPSHVALYRRLTESPMRAHRGRLMIAAGLSEYTQRRERLLNASGFFWAEGTPRLAAARHVVEAFIRGEARDAAGVARALPTIAGVGLARMRRRPFELRSLVMVDQVEQAPNADSRLTLGRERDRLGRRKLRLDWRVGGDTIRTHRRLHRLLADRLERDRIGRLESRLLADPDFVPVYGDAAHPMGATRMSSTARGGVVNVDLRVHGVDNLFVAGSSVFPTGGHANPTLTVVALALRLAEHLEALPSGAG